MPKTSQSRGAGRFRPPTTKLRIGLERSPALTKTSRVIPTENQPDWDNTQSKTNMQRILVFAAVTLVFALSALADDLAKLEGKWSVKKTRNGQDYTQSLELKKDTFKFKLMRGGEDLAIYAEGKIKLEKSGPFNVVKFVDIKAGGSESDISPIDDDHVSIYVLGENTWTVAANFDKERDDQPPSLDAYVKATK